MHLKNDIGCTQKSQNNEMRRLIFGLVALILTSSFAWDAQAAPQQLAKTGEFSLTGKISSKRAGELSITDKDGKTAKFKIQDKDDEAISLEGKIRFRLPAKIKVSGSMPAALIQRGMIVQFETNISRTGKSESKLKKLKVIQGDASSFRIDVKQEPAPDTFEPCTIVGQVVTFKRGKLQLAVPRTRYSKKERITFMVDEAAMIDVTDDSLSQVIAGDQVVLAKGVDLNNGARIIEAIEVKLTADRESASQSVEDELETRFSHLSDEPGRPREVRSDHFIVYTDISDRSANVLLAKLERMYSFVSRYYLKRPRMAIECYVVRVENLSAWSGKIPQIGAAKIAEEAGVTASTTMTNGVRTETKSIVYSCADHGVVQHEAVHAYCAMAFGSTGPVWYAEGMAELGQYWKEGELEVNIEPLVIDFLQHAEPKKLKDIVAAGQITGDSWEAYAWRWALCHLLAYNPNYQKRFKRLGINMMNDKDSDSFDNAFGPFAPQISFEYDQFVQNFGNGYRVDLCIWDWKTKAKNISGSERVMKSIKAAGGWQATGLEVRDNVSYDYLSKGTWKTSKVAEQVSADGDDTGTGKLQAVVFSDFILSKPFDLGAKKRFTPPANGQLFVRCKDAWTELGDNEGEIKAYFRRTPKSESSK